MNDEFLKMVFAIAGFYHSNYGLTEEEMKLLEDEYDKASPEVQKVSQAHRDFWREY